MNGRPVLGIILALFAESVHWTPLRWSFDEETCAKAWQLTTIVIGLAAVLIFLDSTPALALPNLLTWLPPLLLPMQFIQSYGLHDSLPLNTFSFLAKQRRQRNIRLGLTESVIHLNFGNAYFVATMVAATLGSEAGAWLFLPATIILTGWMLLSANRSRPLSLLLALTIAGGLSYAGQRGFEFIENWFFDSGPSQTQFNPNAVSTMIGRQGMVELSPDIVWRLQPSENTPPPSLLRTASYNTLRGSTWLNQRAASVDFKDLTSIEPVKGDIYFLLQPDPPPEVQKESIRAALPRFKLRGAAFAETPLPLPGDAASLRDFELDAIECNSYGSVRVFPKHPVIDGTVLWKANTNPESPPIAKEDLEIPPLEKETLQAIASELQLAERPTLQEKLKVIANWFEQNFSYTLKLTIRSSPYVTTTPTAITQFLTSQRAGHCEYFATATTLLVREAGIPARYATGYAVAERNPKHHEFVIRGTHGHAWCRVWDKNSQRWLDFDTTPGNWRVSLAPQNSMIQCFADALKRFREDFFLWRNQSKNHLAVLWVFSAIGLCLIGFVAKLLWKSKHRLETPQTATRYQGPVIRTPLHALEGHAAKHLGSRPPGRPFAEWLRHLGPTLADSTALTEAIELHQRLRFDPAPALPSDQARLAELAKQLQAALKRS